MSFIVIVHFEIGIRIKTIDLNLSFTSLTKIAVVIVKDQNKVSVNNHLKDC